MRVISGKLKGKSINFLKNSTTRPLKDVVKENIFNILNHSNLISVNLKNSNVLDLYSGIGSFGIECLSRGVKNVTFVEKDIEALKILKSNLSKLSLEKKSLVVNSEIKNFLEVNKKKYEIFFFDPPFSDFSFIKNLEIIRKNEIYKSHHIVIVHRERKTQDNFGNFFNKIVERLYGRSKIIIGQFI